jgi:hypothetical protein
MSGSQFSFNRNRCNAGKSIAAPVPQTSGHYLAFMFLVSLAYTLWISL